jgi:hypothetical protein
MHVGVKSAVYQMINDSTSFMLREVFDVGFIDDVGNDVVVPIGGRILGCEGHGL